MLYKKDWLESCELFNAWWEAETNKPLVQVTAPKTGHENIHAWLNWGFAREPENPEKTVNAFECWCSKMFFGGSAFPDLWINLGPGIVAAYVGAEARYRCDSETVWFETPKTWEELERLEFDPKNKWWLITKNLTSFVTKRSEGKFMVGITDLGGITDIVASLRGSQTLVVDMFRSPEKVKNLSRRILDIWHICYEELYRLSGGPKRGNSAWMGLWAPKRWYPIQCDFAAMLSPKLFKELALPFIKEQCVRLDYTIYHLDGPKAIPHLDHLLSIPELDGIQWTPGEGNPSVDSSEWFPLYRKIQKSGKRLVLLGASRKRVKPLLKILRPDGLLIRTWCPTENEARDLLNELKFLDE